MNFNSNAPRIPRRPPRTMSNLAFPHHKTTYFRSSLGQPGEAQKGPRGVPMLARGGVRGG